MQFIREGDKYRGDRLLGSQEFGHLEGACDWEMEVDAGWKLIVPQEIICTNLSSDMVLWSLSQRLVYFTELTVSFEDSEEEANERKKLSSGDGGLGFVQWKSDAGVL